MKHSWKVAGKYQADAVESLFFPKIGIDEEKTKCSIICSII